MTEPEVTSEPATVPSEALSNPATANGSSLPEATPAPPMALPLNGSTEPPPLPTAEPHPAAVAEAPPLSEPPPAEPHEPLEDRLRRLEALLARLAETPAKETSPAPVAAPAPPLPVAAAAPPAPVAAPAPAAPVATAIVAPEAVAAPPGPSGRGPVQTVRDSATLVVDAGRRLLPLALDAVRRPSAVEPQLVGTSAGGHGSWFLFDLLSDLRTIKHMYGDPRYRLTWTARIVPLAVFIFVLTSQWIGPWSVLPVGIGTLLDKIIDFALAFVAFKVLTREAQRYRATIPQYPPYMP